MFVDILSASDVAVAAIAGVVKFDKISLPCFLALPLLLPPPPPPPAPPPHDDVMLLLLSLAFNIVSSVLAVESLCNVAVAIVGDVDVDDEVVVPNVPILGNGGETAAETRELVEFIREAAFNTVGDSVLTSVVVVAEVLVKAVAFAVVGDFGNMTEALPVSIGISVFCFFSGCCSCSCSCSCCR